MARQRMLAVSAMVALLVAVVTAALAALLAPQDRNITVVEERSGVFRYHRSVVRTSASSSLDGRALYCRASVYGASSVCAIAEDGARVAVKFVRLPTLFGPELIAASASSDGKLIYEQTMAQLRASWIDRSVTDLIEVSLLFGMACYAVLAAFKKEKAHG